MIFIRVLYFGKHNLQVLISGFRKLISACKFKYLFIYQHLNKNHLGNYSLHKITELIKVMKKNLQIKKEAEFQLKQFKTTTKIIRNN